MERLKALPFHSTPQAISCSSRFHGNPAFLFAIWPSSMRFASQNSGCMRTSRTVIVHGLLEVDSIEDFNPIRFVNDLAALILHGLSVLIQLGSAPLEHLAALHQNGAFGVCDHIGAVHLHQVWLEPEAGLTRAGAADHQNIFVSGGLGVFGAAVHGQALSFRQNHIVLRHRVNVGCDVFMGSP